MGIVNLLAKISVQGGQGAISTFLAVKHAAEGAAGGIRGLIGPIGELSTLLPALGAGMAVLVGLKAAGFSTEFDSLTRSLAGVSNGVGELVRKLQQARDLARLPGLGFAESIQGLVRLESAGLSNRLAERTLRQFGNASALSGGKREDTAEALRQLSQVAARGKFTEDNLKVLGERILSLRPIINEVFGGKTNEQINALGLSAEQLIDKVVTGMERRLPQAVGGFQNTLDNLADTIARTLVPLGDGLNIAFGSISPQIENILGSLESAGRSLGEVFAALGTSGVLGQTVEKLANAVNLLVGGNWQNFMASVLTGIVTIVGNLPATVGYLAEILDRTFYNIQIAFANAQLQFADVLEGLKGALAAFGKILSGLFKEVAAELTGVLDKLVSGDGGGLEFRRIGSVSEILQNIQSSAFQGYGQNLQSVLASLGPLPLLPGGLAFRNGQGKNALDNLAGGESPIDALLRSIEENTRKAANALDLRRQATGGGELARIGVTPVEMGRSGAGAIAPLVPGNSQLDRAIKQVIRETTAKENGTRVRIGG
jgi:tape measure domain-containing protein